MGRRFHCTSVFIQRCITHYSTYVMNIDIILLSVLWSLVQCPEFAIWYWRPGHIAIHGNAILFKSYITFFPVLYNSMWRRRAGYIHSADGLSARRRTLRLNSALILVISRVASELVKPRRCQAYAATTEKGQFRLFLFSGIFYQ